MLAKSENGAEFGGLSLRLSFVALKSCQCAILLLATITLPAVGLIECHLNLTN